MEADRDPQPAGHVEAREQYDVDRARAAVPEQPEGYVIFVSLLVLFNSFAVNQALQYKRAGRWRDYRYGERWYLWLSVVAKSLLAWQVFANVLVL